MSIFPDSGVKNILERLIIYDNTPIRAKTVSNFTSAFKIEQIYYLYIFVWAPASLSTA